MSWRYAHIADQETDPAATRGAPNSRNYPQSADKVSESSKDSIIAALRKRVKEMGAENLELKKQLEIVYGEFEMSKRWRQEELARVHKSG